MYNVPCLPLAMMYTLGCFSIRFPNRHSRESGNPWTAARRRSHVP